MNKVRCAIYTRKSTEEGLEQEFNSLDAQREACEAYILSQKHEGWKLLPEHYDDGGISGGTIERPALKQLSEEIDAGRVDMVVVYKVDRLTRSLADFAKLVERLDDAGASFVSVTQQFNTSTSMGRLTLNVLLSFAQFEREVTAERIRDKIAASKKKGMWMGGLVPLGYDTGDIGLIINLEEAQTVRKLYASYLEFGCVRRLKDWADCEGLRSKRRTLRNGKVIGGKLFTRGHIYQLLSNPIYIGKVRHKEEVFDGLHDATIDQAIWDKVQAKLEENRNDRASRKNTKSRSPLAGKLFDEDGEPLTPSHANKKGKRYRYYISRHLIDQSGERQDGWRLPAREIERTVVLTVMQDREVRLYWQAEGAAYPGDQALLDKIDKVQIVKDQLLVSIGLNAEDEPHVIATPFTLRRRGAEMKMLLSSEAKSAPDQTLAKRILRAMSWLDRIKAGEALIDVAADEGISAEYITHNLDLAFLSPQFLTAVIDGKQPPELTTTALAGIKVPADWQAQNKFLLS